MTDEGGAGRGLFITFEGGDGAGKTTQLERVRTWFEDRGRKVLVTREPGGTELGTDLRRLIQHGPEDVDARTEALLYAADRAYHVATVVRPALAAGTVVLGDRYIDSSLAYQGAARDLGVEEIRSLSLWATQGLQPHLTFLLDLPPEVGARRDTGEPDRIERESTDFHERVRHEYLRLAEEHPGRIVVIDGVGTVDQVFAEIQGVLEERVPALVDGAPTPHTPTHDTPTPAATAGDRNARNTKGRGAGNGGAAGKATDAGRAAHAGADADAEPGADAGVDHAPASLAVLGAQAALWGEPDQGMLL